MLLNKIIRKKTIKNQATWFLVSMTTTISVNATCITSVNIKLVSLSNSRIVLYFPSNGINYPYDTIVASEPINVMKS